MIELTQSPRIIESFFEEIKDGGSYLKCMSCGAVYQSKSSMNKHLQRKHLESWKKVMPAKKIPQKI